MSHDPDYDHFGYLARRSLLIQYNEKDIPSAATPAAVAAAAAAVAAAATATAAVAAAPSHLRTIVK